MTKPVHVSNYSVVTLSAKLRRQPYLGALLEQSVVSLKEQNAAQRASAVLAWGRKPSARKAAKLAQQLKLPLWQLEDGFIHSLGQGVLGAASCSLVLDKTGIYYDATAPSDLENLLENNPDNVLSDPALMQRARQLITLIASEAISKYNNAPLTTAHLNLPAGKKVLLVDQTAGDQSLKHGFVNADTAQCLLKAALQEHPDATVLIKTHPDVIAGKKKGCFDLKDLQQQPRIQCISEAVNPIVLLREVEHVYVMTSQLGFEALLLGKPVTCFGVPFYAGWGLTDDRAAADLPVFQRRTRQHSVEQVFAAAYLLYARYVHPDTAARCELEAIMTYIIQQQSYWAENQGRLYCFGFSRWKRNYIRRFLYSSDNELHFVRSKQAALRQGFQAADSHILVWGERHIDAAQALAAETGVPIWRVEDGFIRSVGLGSDYTPPLSLVVDKKGIYYDPTQPSDLENLLQNSHFSDEMKQRARNLCNMLLQSRISKYNSGQQLLNRQITARAEQRIILVPGQVEDDVSIQKACWAIASNTALLKAVRQARPEAYLIYKPHPDVVSGNRRGQVQDTILKQYCDLVLEDVSITDCLDCADEVHTMTSLVGFEGLLRDKSVWCYGIPFYAGWGLTKDRYVLERRSRHLALEELIAATLILYPRYINWQTGAFTTPEFAVQLLQKQLAQQGGKQNNKMNGLRRQWLKGVHIYRGVFNFRY